MMTARYVDFEPNFRSILGRGIWADNPPTPPALTTCCNRRRIPGRCIWCVETICTCAKVW